MNTRYLLLMMSSAISVVAGAQTALLPGHELTVHDFDDASPCAQMRPLPKHGITIPNMDSDSPPCIVKVPFSANCNREACTLTERAGSTLGSIKLELECTPIGAPTGFENPAPELKVQNFRVNNTWVHLSLIEGNFDPPEEPFWELSFCMFGSSNNFCGFAKWRQLAPRAKTDGEKMVKTFIRGIEFQAAMPTMVK